MKRLKIFLIACLAVVSLMALTACGGNRLETPTDLKIDPDTLELTWDEVEGARRYVIKYADEEHAAVKPKYSLERLEEGEYTISVKAVSLGDGTKDSKWSEEISFTKEYENGMEFTLLPGKKAYEVKRAAKGIDENGWAVVPSTFRGKPVIGIGKSAFASVSTLKGITVSEGITYIEESAFSSCSYLEKVDLPSSLTKIGEKAFHRCIKLTDITLPEGVKEIPALSFGYCSALTEFEISDGVEKLGQRAFASCKGLKEITIPDGVTEAAEGVFDSCIGLEKVTIGKGLVIVGDGMFNGCTSLSNVSLAEGILGVDEDAFKGCTSLTAVTLPESLIAIGEDVFSGCTALEEVELGENIQSIGARSFADTKIYLDSTDYVIVGKWIVDYKAPEEGTVDAVIPDGIIGVGDEAMGGCKLKSLVVPDSVVRLGYWAFGANGNLVNVRLGKGITEIPTSAFQSCLSLSRVIIDGDVTSIGNYAFAYTNLNYAPVLEDGSVDHTKDGIVLPNTVAHIGTDAFKDTPMWEHSETTVKKIVYVYCKDGSRWAIGDSTESLGSIELEDGTVGVSNYAFFSLKASQVILPEGLKYIGKAAFYGLQNLRSAELPSSLVDLGEYAFYGCQSLSSITIPNGITTIKKSTFYGCSSLSLCILPGSIESIENYAFYMVGVSDGFIGSIQDVAIIFNDGLKYIGDYAFAKSGISTVNLPDSVEEIGYRAFYDCYTYNTVEIGSGLEKIGEGAFSYTSSLTSVTIPSTVKEIGDYAFYKSTNLENIVIEEGVEIIGKSAFFGTRYSTVTIPESVKTIRDYAFRSNMVGYEPEYVALPGVQPTLIRVEILPTSVVVKGCPEVIGQHAFYGDVMMTVYMEAAEAGENWNKYWNSSRRPIIWGCTVADEGYVVGFTKTDSSISFDNAKYGISAPVRAGYIFGGWATESGSTKIAYTMDSLTSAPDGTALYAIWIAE